MRGFDMFWSRSDRDFYDALKRRCDDGDDSRVRASERNAAVASFGADGLKAKLGDQL